MPKKSNKNILTRSAEAPAIMLDKGVEASEKLVRVFPVGNVFSKTRSYWRILGPGLTTGASDDDPSGIATYSQTGAQFGYHFLWLSVWTLPLMGFVQEMCARIGLVTGRGLASNIRTHFSKKVLYICTLLLFAANVINIGADLGAMAKAVQLLAPGLGFGGLVVGFTLFSLGLQIFTPYARYAKYLKWLALILFSYVISALLAHLDWSTIWHSTLTPSIQFTKDAFLIICAILGTTISPYLFFWQTSTEVEEKILQGKTTVKQRKTGVEKSDIRSMRVDVWSGMLLSNVVMFFIIAACGGILFPNGITEITSAAQAAEALRPFAGDATYFLFAIGIIGTGLLAIPVLAGASSYALAESFRWKEGLYRKLGSAYAFYGVIIISMLIGLGINFLHIDPIQALIYAAVANGLVAPIILALIVLISGNRKIMGRWTNRRPVSWIGWITVAVMAVSGVAAIFAILA